jgi:imidazolonepropionase-like amidohydrolase
MHAHLGPGDLLLNLAAGVTAVRDVGNSHEDLADMRGRIERGELLGPHISANGFIEGKSPFSSQADFVPDTLDEALAAIDWYAAHGYRQLKLYNSIRPEWVRPMVAHARARGLRTGGHVPAFMTARQAVEAGYDELHHINQVTLNFLVSKTDDTRTLLRFNLVGDKAADLQLNDRRTRDFIALLKKKGTVVDPTMVAFEGQYTQRQGQPNPSYAMVAAHLPAVMQRGLLVAETDMDDAKARRWGASWRVMMALLRRMHAAGIPLVAGTDATPGFALHRELELYVQAGIPAAQALKIATWNGAKYSDRLHDAGSIERGKHAELLLVDGDPLADIRALRRVALVFQHHAGQTRALAPAALHQAMGILPFVPAAGIVRTASPASERTSP